MNNIEWSSQFETGIEDIDTQHKYIFELINDLGKIENTAKFYDIIRFLNNLKNYAVTHFKTEEFYMKEMGYPLYKQHKKAHANLIKNIRDAKTSVQSDISNTIFYSAVFEFASNWLTTHILEEDKSFMQFCYNYHIPVNKNYEGSMCEVYDTQNNFLGVASITDINEKEITVMGKNEDNFTVVPNTFVKLHISGKKHTFQTWSGKVAFAEKNVIVLEHVKHISLKNKRLFYRVAADLSFKAIINDKEVDCILMDISIGGISFKCKEPCKKRDIITVKLNIEKEEFALKCSVVRISEIDFPYFKYAVQFIHLNPKEENSIAKYVFEQQKRLR